MSSVIGWNFFFCWTNLPSIHSSLQRTTFLSIFFRRSKNRTRPLFRGNVTQEPVQGDRSPSEVSLSECTINFCSKHLALATIWWSDRHLPHFAEGVVEWTCLSSCRIQCSVWASQPLFLLHIELISRTSADDLKKLRCCAGLRKDTRSTYAWACLERQRTPTGLVSTALQAAKIDLWSTTKEKTGQGADFYTNQWKQSDYTLPRFTTEASRKHATQGRSTASRVTSIREKGKSVFTTPLALHRSSRVSGIAYGSERFRSRSY